MKTYSLEELTDSYIGKNGTKKRDEFENELRLDLVGKEKLYLNQKLLEILENKE